LILRFICPMISLCNGGTDITSDNMLPSYDHIITRISIQTTGLAFGGTGLNMNMNTSLFPTRSHLSPNLAITISVSFAVSVHTLIPRQPPPSPLPLFTPSSTTAILSQPAQVSDHPASTDPELSCTCCCQSSQIQSNHSHPPVSTLAKDN